MHHPMVCSTDESEKRGLGPLSGGDTDAKMVRPQFSKLGSSDCASMDMQEESSPWKLLPSDILEQAFALLPLPEVFRLRCVCKRWNALIHCVEFQELSLRCTVPRGPFYLPWVRCKETGSRTVPWSSYDLAERKWIRMPQFEFPLLNGYSEWRMTTANGGLVCFRSLDGRGVLVCNPLTNRWKELPSGRLDSVLTSVTCLIVNKERNSYKILLAGNSGYNGNNPRYGTVDLYDSMTKTWSIGKSMSIGNVMRDGGAYCNGEFYVLTQRYRKSPYTIVILDLTTLRWKEETIPVPEGFRHYPHIVACLGRIYLVGGRNSSGDHNGRNVFVYQLDRSNRWTKVSEYPDGHLLGISRKGIHGCVANGSKIYVGLHSSDVWVAVYDLATSCWEELIHKGDVLNLQDIFPRTKFTFQPDIRVAP